MFSTMRQFIMKIITVYSLIQFPRDPLVHFPARKANPFTDFRLVKAEEEWNHGRYKCKDQEAYIQSQYNAIVVHKPGSVRGKKK